MGVAGAGDVLGGGAELHRDADLGDQLAGLRADDVARRGCGRSRRRRAASRSRRPSGRTWPGRCRGTGTCRPCRRGPPPSAPPRSRRPTATSGLGVDHARDHPVVHVAVLAGDGLGDRDALVLGLVREHRPGDRVADRVDARRRWSASGRRSAPWPRSVSATPARLEPEARRCRARRPVETSTTSASTRRRRCRPCAACSRASRRRRPGRALHRGAEHERQALLRQQLLEGPDHLHVDAGR